MGYWTRKKILVASLFIFSIIAAAGVQWGDLASFIGDNQFGPENHFGLTQTNNGDELVVNQTVVGSLLWSLFFVLNALIWGNTKKDGFFKFKCSLWSAVLIIFFLYSPGAAPFLASIVASIISFPPIAWGLFWIVIIILYLIYELPTKPILLISIPLLIMVGDLAHGWFWHYPAWGILGTLSFFLHLLVILAYIGWMLTIISVLTVLTALVLILAVTAVIIVFLTCVILIIVALILIASMLCGETPREVGNSFTLLGASMNDY